MAFDGITLKSIIYELQKSLINGKINKIYEPNKNEIILGIYNASPSMASSNKNLNMESHTSSPTITSSNKNFSLDICIDSSFYRMTLTTHAKPNPMNALNFCMLLRKHILGYKIKNIYSNENMERIATLELEGYNELNDLNTKFLIIELMGKHSNIILTNENHVIIDSLRHLDITSNSSRDILPAHQYISPKNNKKNYLKISDFEEFKDIIKKVPPYNLIKAISNTFTGFSRTFMEYLVLKNNIDPNDFSDKNLQILYDSINFIISNLDSNNICLNLYNKNFKNDISLESENNSNEANTSTLPTEKLNKHSDYVISSGKKENLGINYFIDDFYFKKEEITNFVAYRNSLLKLISHLLKRYNTKLETINQKLDECQNKEKYQLYGELIIANLYRLPHAGVRHTPGHNLQKIELENYYDNNKLVEIPLDPSLSIPDNATKYFKKYDKLKNTYDIVSIQKKKINRDLVYISGIIERIKDCNSIEEIDYIFNEISESTIFKDFLNIPLKNSKFSRNNSVGKKASQKEKSSEPREFNVDGYTVLVGKNNKQNDLLTTKIASKNDIWFHTKDIHGSHVILLNPQDGLKESTLIKVAKLAAYYSKARISSNVPVDYTLVKYVKKPNGSKPGLVIYTNNKTLYVNPESEI